MNGRHVIASCSSAWAPLALPPHRLWPNRATRRQRRGRGSPAGPRILNVAVQVEPLTIGQVLRRSGNARA